MNQYLPTTPFDIYELHLFHLVAKHGSFTKASEIAGLTQSAITRQIQNMETSLGLKLLERTTRRVGVTPAGEFLLRETNKTLGDIDATLRQLLAQYVNAPKEVRVGVSRSICLAHLPGFFFANQRKHPDVISKVSHQASQEILSNLEANELDVGVLCPPERLSKTLKVTHQFKDEFALIAPKTLPPPKKESLWRDWLGGQHLLLIHEESNTGRQVQQWLTRKGVKTAPVTQMDNFDLIINLVALGMGVSLVPRRALAFYPRKKSIQQIRMPERFSRNLVVLTRRHKKPLEHISRFVENILF
ncbi:MAG: LysR family transcriptional regulator [Chthoniobacteraceae bacterium]